MSRAEGDLCVRHFFSFNKENFGIALTAKDQSYLPGADSIEHFFKEHEVGYGRDKKKNTLEYKVEHPVWEIYPVKNVESTICFEKIYGKYWAFLDAEKPFSTLLAKGSEIKVFEKA